LHEVVIIGGGPAGLTAGMFLRMRRMSVLVLDASRPGGQLISVYGEKPVHDWPGEDVIVARTLAERLVEHATGLGVEILPERKVLELEKRADGSFVLQVLDIATDTTTTHEAGAVVVAIGGGAFEPRRLRVQGEEKLTEDSVSYRMAEATRVAGKRVVVVGGGDSGLESAQAAREAGATVTLLQVLDHLTGMEKNIEAVGKLGIPVRLETRVKAVEHEDGAIRAVLAQAKGAAEPERLACDHLIVNIGAAVNLDAVKRWGIAVEGSQIPVDAAMQTSLEGVYACGDIVTYPGKYKLLITASGEGAVAANSAYLYVRKPQRVTMTDLYTAPKDTAAAPAGPASGETPA
jgi:ferredoxin/flavodoxin---NADP+ reductase